MSLNILAIDDSRTIRELLKHALGNAGFQVTTADDGVDVNMPRMDGFGVIETIRAGNTNSRVPILVLTTESGDDLKARARQAGATGWIVKPFDDAALISALKRVAGA